MKDLPILVKPYLTLDETFERLKQAGAQLDKPEDILLLARNGLLKVSLLCDESVTLVRTDQAKVVRKAVPSEGEIPIEELTKKLLADLFWSKGEIEDFIYRITNDDWVVAPSPRQIIAGQSDGVTPDDGTICINKPYYDGYPFVTYSGRASQLFFTPLRLIHEMHIPDVLDRDQFFAPIDWLREQINSVDFCNLSVVEHDGLTYYVCTLMDNPFVEGRTFTVPYEGGEVEVNLSYVLNSSLLKRLIEKGNYVVTKKAVELFEQQHLNINHGINTAETPAYLDDKSEHYARELAIAIEAHTAIFVNNQGNKNASPSARVKAWLEKNYPNESNVFYQRITTVVLPKK